MFSTAQLAEFAPIIKRRAETRERIRVLEAQTNDPNGMSFFKYCEKAKDKEIFLIGCAAPSCLIGVFVIFVLISEGGLPSGFLFLCLLFLIAGGIGLWRKIKENHEKWKVDRSEHLNSEQAKAKSELAELNSALSWYDNFSKEEREKFDASVLAEERRQAEEQRKREEERQRQEQERAREQQRIISICPQCKKEWALNTSWETIGTNNEFRTELKEEWVQTGRGLTDGFYQKIPIQIQTVVTTEREVTKCSYCSYRKEGRTRKNRQEIR